MASRPVQHWSGVTTIADTNENVMLSGMLWKEGAGRFTAIFVAGAGQSGTARVKYVDPAGNKAVLKSRAMADAETWVCDIDSWAPEIETTFQADDVISTISCEGGFY